MELCGALKNNYFERCQVSAPLLVAGAATFHSLEDNTIQAHRLSEDVDSGATHHAPVRARVDQATSLNEITSEMYLSKQDPRLMEEATFSGDLERYKHAVAAMKYYGARVGAGVGAVSGDGRPRCKSRGDERRITAVLPATIPAASRLVYLPGDCYYAVTGDASDSSSRDDASQHRPSLQRLSPQRLPHQHPSPQLVSPERLSPGQLSPERLSPERLSPQQRRSPNQLSPLRYSLSDDHPTNRAPSSQAKYSSNQQVTNRAENASGRSLPGRTRIPVANTSRENFGYDCKTSVKETNVAYFATTPPANPLPAVFHPPSMCQRRDVKHSCLANGHLHARAVDADTVRRCERAVAEAVRAGRDPSHLDIPPAALQCIPPRRSIDSLKDKTVSLRQRLDQLKSKRSEKVKNKEASGEFPKLKNILRNGTFGEPLGSRNSKSKEMISDKLETLDSNIKKCNDECLENGELKNKDIINEGLEKPDSKCKGNLVGDLEIQEINDRDIFGELSECNDSQSKNVLIDCSESRDSMCSEILIECLDGEESMCEEQKSIRSKDTTKISEQNLYININETSKEEMLDNFDQIAKKLSKSNTFVKEDGEEHFINQHVLEEEANKEISVGSNKGEVSSNDQLKKIDCPSGDNRGTGCSAIRQGACAPAVGAAGEAAGESKGIPSELKYRDVEASSSRGTVLHGSTPRLVPSDITLKNSMSNLSSVLPIDMLAEGLLMDIVKKFSSQENLCTDLRMRGKEQPAERDGKADVFAAANELLKQQLSPLDEESGDERRDVDTSEYSGYNTTNSREDEALSAQLKRMARIIVEQGDEEFFIEPAPPTPEECDEWRSLKERRNSSERSISTERGSMETKESQTSNRYDAKAKERVVAADASVKSCRSVCERDGETRRTASRSKGVQVLLTQSSARCDKAQSHLMLSKRPTHREIETNVSQRHLNEELACVPNRSVSGRRLLADLKRSQRMLGMVDAVLNDETTTSSDGTCKSLRRVRSRRAVTVPSAHMVSVPTDQSRCSACQVPSSGGIGGSQCMQQLQLLRNEQLHHIQRQVQQIVNINKFIDAHR